MLSLTCKHLYTKLFNQLQHKEKRLRNPFFETSQFSIIFFSKIVQVSMFKVSKHSKLVCKPKLGKNNKIK